MWTSTQSWPTCHSSPKPSSSLEHLCDPNSTPRRRVPMAQVCRNARASPHAADAPLLVSTEKLWASYCSETFLTCCLLCEGVEPVGNVVMKKATFTVETISAGMGEVLVYVEDPAGHREEVCDPSLCVTSTFSFVHLKTIVSVFRLKWRPTMTRTVPTLLSMSPKWQACTRWVKNLMLKMWEIIPKVIFQVENGFCSTKQWLQLTCHFPALLPL